MKRPSEAPAGFAATQLKRSLEWLVRLRGSKRAIARGAAIGMLVAFTPTIGTQTLIALGLATLLNGNRPIAIVPTLLTNPFTIPPIYAFTYYLGSLVWPGPALSEVSAALSEAGTEIAHLDFFALRDHLDVFAALGFDVFVAMWIGGLVVGTVAAAITYPVTLRTVERLRRRATARHRN